MREAVLLVLILLAAVGGYAAGRAHGQVGYRQGLRVGYRQGYADGDRASWTRRRRDLQASIASVLATPPEQRTAVYRAAEPVGGVYLSSQQLDL